MRQPKRRGCVWRRSGFVFELVPDSCGLCPSQIYPPPADVVHPNQEIRVSGLPPRAAQSTDFTATLVAALETTFHDSELCCGKNSALREAVLSADPLSFEELSSKLQGRHILGDGRRIMVTAVSACELDKSRSDSCREEAPLKGGT